MIGRRQALALAVAASACVATGAAVAGAFSGSSGALALERQMQQAAAKLAGSQLDARGNLYMCVRKGNVLLHRRAFSLIPKAQRGCYRPAHERVQVQLFGGQIVKRLEIDAAHGYPLQFDLADQTGEYYKSANDRCWQMVAHGQKASGALLTYNANERLELAPRHGRLLALRGTEVDHGVRNTELDLVDPATHLEVSEIDSTRGPGRLTSRIVKTIRPLAAFPQASPTPACSG